MHDLIIIGGGPAGMTAGVYAARKRLNTVLLSLDLGGQANWTQRIENYMGYQFIEGQELMARFEDQVKQFPIVVRTSQTVTHVHKLKFGFAVQLETGEVLEARAVILASGKRPRPLNVPGEARLRGKGVTYCAVCDGPLFGGEDVMVVGGGNSALEAASDMAAIASHVYLVSITQITGDAILLEKVKSSSNVTILCEHQVVDIEGDTRVQSVRVEDLKTEQTAVLNVAAVFVEVGLIPNSDPVRELVSVNDRAEVLVNCRQETSIPGLFAAGDVTDVPEKQIVVAAGEGAKAALQAQRYLLRLPPPG